MLLHTSSLVVIRMPHRDKVYEVLGVLKKNKGKPEKQAN